MPLRTDTLVIGAGAAGLFCALRWAERGPVTVVEAGPDAGDPPPRWALYDYVLPDAHYYRYTDTRTGKPIPQGRGLGGGSTVNSAAALRGQPWCYDGWQLPGWSWSECLAGFRAIEADQFASEAAKETMAQVAMSYDRMADDLEKRLANPRYRNGLFVG